MGTLEYLIDITTMDTVYRHILYNPEINSAIQVHGTREMMGKLAYSMTTDDASTFLNMYKNKECSMLEDINIPTNNKIWVIYLPPYYLFIDSGEHM